MGQILIRYGMHSSPFGGCLIGVTGRSICQLSFMKSANKREALRHLKEAWPKAILKRDDIHTRSYFKKIFKPRNSKHPFHLLAKGTHFQIKVWKALLTIPEGKITSYAKIARKAGFPKAVRAVGTACGKNPIGFLIPCHRVLASDGKLGGYRWGIKRKEMMLAWESTKKSGSLARSRFIKFS